MFIYFSGIQSENGKYAVEVSSTADDERQQTTVPSAFYMKFPLELLTRTLDTYKNTRINEEMITHKDTKLVKSMRKHHGKKMLTSEAVTLQTNWNEMIDRNILVRSSMIDENGIERYLSAGASYDTISMYCPLGSQLVGFASKKGEPAMIFMTAQDESSKRSEDKEHDSIIQLHIEARSKYYDLDLVVESAEVSNFQNLIQTISQEIQTLVTTTQREQREEKAIANSSSNIFAQLQRATLSDDTDRNKLVAANVRFVDNLIYSMKNTLHEAETIRERIDAITQSVHAWDAEKKAQAEEKYAAAKLIAEGNKSAERNVVVAGLPAEGALARVMRARADLENTVESMNADHNNFVLPNNDLLEPSTQMRIPLSVPVPMEVESKTQVSINIPATVTSSSSASEETSSPIPEQRSVQILEQSEAPRTVETVVEASVQTTAETPAPIRMRAVQQPTLYELPRWLQVLVDKMESLHQINNRLTQIKPEAAQKIESIATIVNTVKSARVQRNKEIVNWPAARDLIAASKKPFAQGYTQWTWYHTSFPHLFVNYLFDLLVASGSWNDISFPTVNALSNDLPLATTPILFRPVTEKSYSEDAAYQAQLSTTRKQVEKLSNLVMILTNQIEVVQVNFKAILDRIDEYSNLPDSAERTNLLTQQQGQITSLDLQLKRLRATTKEAIQTYETADKLFKEKYSPVVNDSKQDNMDIEEEQKGETLPVVKTRDELAVEEAQRLIKNGLVTAVATKNINKFLQWYSKATPAAIASALGAFKEGTKNAKTFNEFQNQSEIHNRLKK